MFIMQALVRMGLLTASLDSPMHSAWTNTKLCNGKTQLSCQACMVPRESLGDPLYDFSKNRRTADGLQEDLAAVASAATSAEATALSMTKGVVVGAHTNPIAAELNFDLIEGIGMDALHQVLHPYSRKVNGYIRFRPGVPVGFV